LAAGRNKNNAIRQKQRETENREPIRHVMQPKEDGQRNSQANKAIRAQIRTAKHERPTQPADEETAKDMNSNVRFKSTPGSRVTFNAINNPNAAPMIRR
jgi:hypothetical protein